MLANKSIIFKQHEIQFYPTPVLYPRIHDHKFYGSIFCRSVAKYLFTFVWPICIYIFTNSELIDNVYKYHSKATKFWFWLRRMNAQKK